jgi:hypothetical protein
MAIYYNNDAKLLMDIKPNAVPFAGEDIVVPILTAMTASERETCVNGNATVTNTVNWVKMTHFGVKTGKTACKISKITKNSRNVG